MRLRPRLGLLPLALTLLGAGCALRAPATDRGDVVRRIVPSAVQLRTERTDGARRAGSGVVVGSGGGRSWIVTTHHLLWPAGQRVHAHVPGHGSSIPATLVATSAEADLALFRVDGLDLPPVALRTVAGLGEPVLVVAFPWGRRMTVVSGIVSQLAADDGEGAVEGSARMVDASVSYGSSGGGVFDRDGFLVGLVEGYRTTEIAPPGASQPVVRVPTPGETHVIGARAIRLFLDGTGLADLTRR